MSTRARLLTATDGPPCWFRVYVGSDCDLTWRISDRSTGHPVDWTNQVARFRVYTPFSNHSVVLEITDPKRCRFEPDGIWRLHLTAKETESLPPGGMLFTLEHGQDENSLQVGVEGGVSCYEIEIRVDPAERKAAQAPRGLTTSK